MTAPRLSAKAKCICEQAKRKIEVAAAEKAVKDDADKVKANKKAASKEKAKINGERRAAAMAEATRNMK